MSDEAVELVGAWGDRSPDGGTQPKKSLGVSSFLPRPAALALVRAAEAASCFEPYSVQRTLIIERAIKQVKSEYPRFFLQSCHGSKRPGTGDRRASPERPLLGSRGGDGA